MHLFLWDCLSCIKFEWKEYYRKPDHTGYKGAEAEKPYE